MGFLAVPALCCTPRCPESHHPVKDYPISQFSFAEVLRLLRELPIVLQLVFQLSNILDDLLSFCPLVRIFSLRYCLVYIVDDSSLFYQHNSAVVRVVLTMMIGQRSRADVCANEVLSEVDEGAIVN